MDCRHIQFSLETNHIDFSQLLNLFKISAFWAQDRTIEDLKIAVDNSNPVVTIWDHQQLIGFARATSDKIYRATIWDVIVHPNYRGLGLGRKLVETILTHPQVNRVERVYLMTTHQQSFYQKIGFEENKTTTMMLENSYLSTSEISHHSNQSNHQLQGESHTVTV
jgi:ribosomal protein S18 acetylase RimI-like enzyme